MEAPEAAAHPVAGRTGSLLFVSGVMVLFLVGLLLQPVSRDGSIELTLWGLTLPSVCWFRYVTGFPCASCGLTRSVVLLLHGQLAESVGQHPFGVVAAMLAGLQLPPRIAVIFASGGRWTSRWDRAWGIAALGALLLMTGWWAIRTLPAAVGAWTP